MRLTTTTLIIAFAAVISAHARESAWEPLTTEEHPECNREKPCKVNEPNGEFYVRFVMKDPVEDGSASMDRIEIWSDKGEKQEFTLDEMNSLATGEYYKIYKVSLRPGPYKDLALFAYSSAHEGEMYYYFLYDNHRDNFVVSDETLPKLHYNSRTRTFKSELQGNTFILRKNLRIYEKP